MKNRLFLQGTVLVTALLIRWEDSAISTWAVGIFPPGSRSSTVAVNLVLILWYVLPVAWIVAFFHGRGNLWHELGLDRWILRGIGYGFVFTLPMLFGYAVLGSFTGQDVFSVVVNQLRAALREEVFYRAFLFGQLFRHGRWGFLPAVGLSAIVFATGHLYQASSFEQAIMIMAITFIGGLWFAWLYVAWDYNLLMPISLHLFMNLWWELFAIGHTAIATSASAELLRALTVLGSIGWTLWARKGSSFLPSTALWWQRESASPAVISSRQHSPADNR